MKNLLKLHEAIVIALVNIDKQTFSASFEDVANFINKRGLYSERKGKISLAKQVMLRSTKSKGKYHYLFIKVDDNNIKLNGIE